MGRRSRSSSGSRSRSHSRNRGRSRSRSSDGQTYRVHIGDLGTDCSTREVQKAFEVFGKVEDVWVAHSPPCFGFVVYKKKECAEEAVRQMNGQYVCGGRVRVTMALPRARERRRGRPFFDQNMKCYMCGEAGHFSRDCRNIGRNRTRFSPRRRPSPRRRRKSTSESSGSRSRSRSRPRKSGSGSRKRRSRSASWHPQSRSPSAGRSSHTRRDSTKKSSSDKRSRSKSGSRRRSSDRHSGGRRTSEGDKRSKNADAVLAGGDSAAAMSNNEDD